MPDILWTGEMPFLNKMILNINGILAYILGNMRDTDDMKKRIITSYDGDRTAVVKDYDNFGEGHYDRIASSLIDRIDVDGKKVLEVGCGTGILTIKLLERRAAEIHATDISRYMLDVLE